MGPLQKSKSPIQGHPTPVHSSVSSSSMPLCSSLSLSLSFHLFHLPLISPLISWHSVSLYFLFFFPLQHVSHPTSPSLSDKCSFFCHSKAKRKEIEVLVEEDDWVNEKWDENILFYFFYFLNFFPFGCTSSELGGDRLGNEKLKGKQMSKKGKSLTLHSCYFFWSCFMPNTESSQHGLSTHSSIRKEICLSITYTVSTLTESNRVKCEERMFDDGSEHQCLVQQQHQRRC